MADRERKLVMLIIGGSEPKQVQDRLISSCLSLVQYISSDLEVLIPDLDYWPHKNMFSNFKKRMPHFRLRVTAFGSYANMFEEVKSEIQSKNPIFLVLDRNHFVKQHTKQDKILHSKILSEVSTPILLVTCHRQKLKVPFLSLFVPMSGEVKSSPALEWSINFANEMQLPVDLLHVTHQDKWGTYDPSLIGKLCDEFYHEYPHLISEFLAQGSPYSSMREKTVIRHFIHCTGLELDEIIKSGRKETRPLVIIEWKGSLEKGHAKVLKGIVSQTDWPILLTRQRINRTIQIKSLRSFRAA